jgi:hypothetical protein
LNAEEELNALLNDSRKNFGQNERITKLQEEIRMLSNSVTKAEKETKTAENEINDLGDTIH